MVGSPSWPWSALADWPRDSAWDTDRGDLVYRIIRFKFKPRVRSIDVNNLGHQGMLPVDRAGPAYFLPHLLNRDSGGKPFDDVMIDRQRVGQRRLPRRSRWARRTWTPSRSTQLSTNSGG